MVVFLILPSKCSLRLYYYIWYEAWHIDYEDQKNSQHSICYWEIRKAIGITEWVNCFISNDELSSSFGIFIDRISECREHGGAQMHDLGSPGNRERESTLFYNVPCDVSLLLPDSTSKFSANSYCSAGLQTQFNHLRLWKTLQVQMIARLFPQWSPMLACFHFFLTLVDLFTEFLLVFFEK